MKKILFLLLFPLSLMAQMSTTGLRIGNNPGWYGSHYTDEQVHQLMLNAGNTSTRYFITLDVWRSYGFGTFVERIKNAYDMGMRFNAFALTGQFYTLYPDQDTTTYPDNQGKRVRTQMPKGLYETIFLSTGAVNPKNRYAVYCMEAVQAFGPYFDYWEVWNEPDITYFTLAADDPNYKHNPDSWWHREPRPAEMYNSVAPVKDYVRLCEIAYRVVKKYKPAAKVCTGGLGYPAFGYWFHKLGGGKWYDVLSIHEYPVYFLREWSNELGRHVYNRHSDYVIAQSIDRVRQWQQILKQFNLKKPVICTEINIPRYSPDPIYESSEVLQRNFTLKLFPKFLEAGVDRTWLFVVGEVAEVGASNNMFDYMGLYLNLKRPENVGKEVMTQAAIACGTMDSLLDGARVDDILTAALHLGGRVDGVGMRLTNTKRALMLWCKTTQDLNEAVSWPYRLPAGLGSYRMYKWDYSKTGIVTDVLDPQLNLTGEPIILIEK